MLLPAILPAAPTGLKAAYFGASGGSTSRYYWVRALYPSGRSAIAGPILVTTVATLTKDSRVLVTWDPMPGAVGYDLLQTTSSTLPTTTASIAVATGLDANSYSDEGVTLASYRIWPAGTRSQCIQVFHAIYDFAVDGGAQGEIVPALTVQIPKNVILIGATLDVPAAFTSGGAATVAVGTTAGSAANSIRVATAIATLSLNALVNGSVTFAAPVKMSAAGNISVTVAAADLTAGKMEILVYGVMTQDD